MRDVAVNGLSFNNQKPLVLIAGPCVIESESSTIALARRLSKLARAAGLHFVFKASYDKANRSSIASYRGPGLLPGLAVLRRVKEEVGCPVLTDVHWKEDVPAVAEGVDILQVPAFLCRQTDLLLACGRTGRPELVDRLGPTGLRRSRSSGNS